MMAESTFLVVQPGVLTTIQDLGRFGYGSIGMPAAGAMDPYAHQLANLMVGNSLHEATLEMTFIGPTLVSKGSHRIALAGGDLGAELNEIPLPSCGSWTMREGDTLTFKGGSGVRSYLAVAGGWDVETVLGSKSTYTRAKLGGYQGRPLKKEDSLNVGSIVTSLRWQGSLPMNLVDEFFSTEKPIRVLWGPQDDYFSEKEKARFLEQSWTVNKDSDRMGYRLDGNPLIHLDKKEIISDGVCQGAIQVPGHGQPIVLLADAQTTGGYPKIATIISSDLGRPAHYKAGDFIQFQSVTYEEAIQIMKERQQQIHFVQDWIQSRERATSHLWHIYIDSKHYRVRVDEKPENQ